MGRTAPSFRACPTMRTEDVAEPGVSASSACLSAYVFTYIYTYVCIYASDSIRMCLSGLAMPASAVLELFQPSPEPGDGLPQLVDLLLLLRYLGLDAGRLLGGEIFERQPFDDVAPVPRHHALVASDGHVDVHMPEFVHGLAQRAALDHEHRRVRRPQGVERHVLAVDSLPRGAELPLDRGRVQDPFRMPDRVEEHRVGIPVGTKPVDVLPDEAADRGGNGHDASAFRGLRVVEPVFAQVVRPLRHGMAHIEKPVFEIDVPQLQAADLSDAQPAHQQREMDRQAVVFRKTLDQRVDLLFGQRRLLASFGRSLPRDEVAWIRGQQWRTSVRLPFGRGPHQALEQPDRVLERGGTHLVACFRVPFVDEFLGDVAHGCLAEPGEQFVQGRLLDSLASAAQLRSVLLPQVDDVPRRV